MNKKTLAIVIALLVVVVLVAGFFVYVRSEVTAQEITEEDAYALIDTTLESMMGKYACNSVKYIAENTDYTIDSIEYGSNKDIVLFCSISTIDAKSVILANKAELLSFDPIDPKTGINITSTKLKKSLDPILLDYLKDAKKKALTLEVYIYDTKDGLELHTSNEMVDAFFGGVIGATEEITKTETVEHNGETVSVGMNIRRGLNECYALSYSARKPDASVPIIKAWNNFKYDFHRNFIKDNNWKYITKGLWTTVQITLFSSIIGIVLGFVVAITRVTYSKIGTTIRNPLLRGLLSLGNKICGIYLTILRGTPVLVQLMIIYFVIFMPIGVNKYISAIMCFGLNSGAYVAEIVRGGIMSIDDGQMEAGRSLGFNYPTTMFFIVLPQAFKAVLPALANEFIVLLKETSVSAYIGLNDLARGGDIIRGVTYSAFMPLIAVAIIYLIVVVALSYLVGILERRLRNNER